MGRQCGHSDARGARIWGLVHYISPVTLPLLRIALFVGVLVCTCAVCIHWCGRVVGCIDSSPEPAWWASALAGAATGDIGNSAAVGLRAR